MITTTSPTPSPTNSNHNHFCGNVNQLQEDQSQEDPRQPGQRTQDWRQQAMSEALATHDTRTAHILRQVMQYSSHKAVLLMRCDHDRLVETLEKHHGARALLPISARWMEPGDDELSEEE